MKLALMVKVNKAAAAGLKAFADGRKAVPCLDPALMALLADGDANAVLDAWISAFHSANAAAPWDFSAVSK
jgi:hypothetical protein